MTSQRCATVAIVGKPNVGKSTLLNAMVGQKLAIATRKPQTTRLPVVGLVTTDDCQLVLVDQPGLLDSSELLHQAMRDATLTWVRRSDILLYLHPADRGDPPGLETLVPELGSLSQPVAVVRTKVDRLDVSGLSALSEAGSCYPVSAVTGQGLRPLLEWCRARAPLRPFQFDAEALSTQPERFFVAEFVREAAFDLLGQELPYALATEVEEFREEEDPIYIRVTVFVERETQRRMVIGKGGSTIKRLGAASRRQIEELLGQRVYLDLWVKTLPKWRSKPQALARFGFDPPTAKLE